MPELKARLFDMIKRGGSAGVDGEDIFHAIFFGRKCKRSIVKVHVCQINDLLIETDYRIVASRGKYPIYRLVKCKS